MTAIPNRPAEIGDVMPDGSIYAGVSPDTGRPMYTTPKDARRVCPAFGEAAKYASKLYAHGHRDWRPPTKAELKVLFQNRAKIGGFNETGSRSVGWHASSSEAIYPYVWIQRFSDGRRDDYGYAIRSSLRCVRG